MRTFTFRYDKEAISSIGRSVDVLREFLTPSINMTPKKLARRTELPKTTVHRTMSELGRVGMLE